MKGKNKLVGKQVVTMSNFRKEQSLLLKVIIFGREKSSKYNGRKSHRRNGDEEIVFL